MPSVDNIGRDVTSVTSPSFAESESSPSQGGAESESSQNPWDSSPSPSRDLPFAQNFRSYF